MKWVGFAVGRPTMDCVRPSSTTHNSNISALPAQPPASWLALVAVPSRSLLPATRLRALLLALLLLHRALPALLLLPLLPLLLPIPLPPKSSFKGGNKKLAGEPDVSLALPRRHPAPVDGGSRPQMADRHMSVSGVCKEGMVDGLADAGADSKQR